MLPDIVARAHEFALTEIWYAFNMWKNKKLKVESFGTT